MAEFTIMLNSDYGIKKKPITTLNPQVNAIIERIHQTIGNILCTFCIQESQLDNDDPWSGILDATMFATRATINTTLKATPMQLLSSRDTILNISYQANWKLIKYQKQKLIEKNNALENKNKRSYL